MKRFTREVLPRHVVSIVALVGLAFTFAVQANTHIVVWGSDTYGQTNVPAGLTNVVAIAAGGDHSLALRENGTVIAWGKNSSGQTNVPTGLSSVIAISGGGEDSLALKSDRTMVTWGSNGAGQGAIPPGLDHVSGIASGFGHHLALRLDGTVVAWGYNFDNQAQVPAELHSVTAIAGGEYHSLALKRDGTVTAWGASSSRENSPFNPLDSFGQTDVPSGLSNVIAIAAGSFHNLALKADGTVIGWGRNDFGQTNGPPDLTNAVAIAAGDGYSLALRNDGTVAFWGYDYFHLSNPVPQLSNVVAIAAGVSHCVALVNDGEPSLIRGPTSQTVYAGGTASLHVTAVGEPPLRYQWKHGGDNLPGATNASLILDSAKIGDAGNYTVVVGNQHGEATSSNAELTVITNFGAPFIVSQPCSRSVVSGSTALFAVEAGGNPPLHYQWLFNHADPIAGATNDLLRLDSVAATQAGVYSVEITNAYGSVTSAESDLSMLTNIAWIFHTPNYVFSSPAIAPDGTVYIGSADGKVYALSGQGAPKWAFVTGAEVQSSPAIGTDGTIYVGSGDSYLYAINPDGSQKWRFKTGDFILSSPALGADGTIYINSRDGKLHAVNPDGTEQWAYNTGQYYNDMQAVIGPDATIFIGAGGEVQALNLKGDKLWDAPAGGWSGGSVSVVIGRNGVVYGASAGDGMRMVALTYQGKKLWEFPFGNPMVYGGPSFPSIGSDGTIYIAASDGSLYAINPDGSQKWKVPATRSQSSPALSSDGKIYLNSDWDFRLLCYNTNGVFQWEYLLGGSGTSGLISSFPTLQHGVLYFGSGNGNVYAYNVSGELVGSAWPSFGRDPQHSNRDIQRRIEATVSSSTGIEELNFVVEPNRSYRIQGTSNLLDWVDCQSFVSTNAFVTLAAPAGYSYFRLVSP